mmetsp:Transcript_13423/g.38166  ORF Transcript_13423/g.38166 Transcript_13423/m.38166 type:complete len:180 (-) Transcript_13423:122-661(-)|eukprot:CAMPEP_0119132226 /NCGR_PEP_ID=MMETSP1310-20130426/11728_1 /TAXON_ID=464262 /ORGANISM="Genus nov. species nov., Strain RCC2339" /LENGTH=179 /DNA_ID=CAMNT_0007122847 /DNA_START=80 /DNA_END=619 /DNA_ORIENTATION=-
MGKDEGIDAKEDIRERNVGHDKEPVGKEPVGMSALPVSMADASTDEHEAKAESKTLQSTKQNKVSSKKLTSKERKVLKQRTTFERLNYLWQAGHAPVPPELAAFYSETLLSLSGRSVTRIDSTVKRVICRGCGNFLDGDRCTVRLKPKREPHIVVTCRVCGSFRRFPTAKERAKTKLTD